MHVPSSLGGYPLVLRDKDTTNTRVGELLYDYNKNDLYYINRQDKMKKSIAKDIYDKIIASRLENTYVEITQSDGKSEKETPLLENRVMNHFYMNITKRDILEQD